jgi:hypothetical protein
MARLPRLELATQILPAGFTQFLNDLRVLRCQPIVQFIKTFDGREHWHRNLDNVPRHTLSVSALHFESKHGAESVGGGN